MLAFVEREELKTAVVQFAVAYDCPYVHGAIGAGKREVKPNRVACGKVSDDSGAEPSFSQIAAQAPRRGRTAGFRYHNPSAELVAPKTAPVP